MVLTLQHIWYCTIFSSVSYLLPFQIPLHKMDIRLKTFSCSLVLIKIVNDIWWYSSLKPFRIRVATIYMHGFTFDGWAIRCFETYNKLITSSIFSPSFGFSTVVCPAADILAEYVIDSLPLFIWFYFKWFWKIYRSLLQASLVH